MTSSPSEILKQYWGFSSFRPAQEEIISSVLAKRDTLALLPTGGGKSICFQLPVMAQEGIGIVISPLVALMADQVNTLKQLGIPALALSSGLSHRELDTGLDNCVHGQYKFLYLSPERLQSELVRARLARMKVNLLVVDEAHCISQWGYDFRPPYTRIAEIRDPLPDVPIIALTATATPKVVKDIQEKLRFSNGQLIQTSFARSNLHYNVVKTEKKWSKITEILGRIKGSAIIYVRNRKRTVEVANWLKQQGFSAEYYHAGLSTELRRKNQENWIRDEIRVMVSTNAFGMGIDKPDVRLVLHIELPDSLEAYFQEAGRAGRDGQTSYSVIILGPSDINELKQKNLESFPKLEFIKRVYQALANHLQLALGSGENLSYPFDLNTFCKEYDLPVLKTYNSLKILEKEGLLAMSEGFRQPSRLHIKAEQSALYDFQLRNPNLDIFIKTLSRSYGGISTDYTPISETLLSSRLKVSEADVIRTLKHLQKQGLIDYVQRSGESEISILESRQSTRYLSISDENLKDRYEDRKRRIDAVESYVMEQDRCRSQMLLSYFGERDSPACGHCDICRRKARQNETLDGLIEQLRELFRSKEKYYIQELSSLADDREKDLITALRWLLDNDEIGVENDQYFAI